MFKKNIHLQSSKLDEVAKLYNFEIHFIFRRLFLGEILCRLLNLGLFFLVHYNNTWRSLKRLNKINCRNFGMRNCWILQAYTCLHVCVTVNHQPCCSPSVSLVDGDNVCMKFVFRFVRLNFVFPSHLKLFTLFFTVVKVYFQVACLVSKIPWKNYVK